LSFVLVDAKKKATEQQFTSRSYRCFQRQWIFFNSNSFFLLRSTDELKYKLLQLETNVSGVILYDQCCVRRKLRHTFMQNREQTNQKLFSDSSTTKRGFDCLGVQTLEAATLSICRGHWSVSCSCFQKKKGRQYHCPNAPKGKKKSCRPERSVSGQAQLVYPGDIRIYTTAATRPQTKTLQGIPSIAIILRTSGRTPCPWRA